MAHLGGGLARAAASGLLGRSALKKKKNKARSSTGGRRPKQNE
jgi:hypothetical protein